jgi:flavin-dependent thymidylate synthase
MKVTLISYTKDAIELMIFTKNTRLRMAPAGLDEIRSWPRDKQMQELKYMSTTVPSSWEFVDLTFCIEGVSRAFTHQLVRTRTASYAQQAMRVVDMDGFDYHIGPTVTDQAKVVYDSVMRTIQQGYNQIIKEGAKPEDARGVLPTDILTNICMKINLRNFSDLVKKRMTPRVQDEYAQVLKLMVEETLKVWPWALMFIMPRQSESFKELGQYMQEQLNKEMKETGKPQHETRTWAMMKHLDILRQE